VQLYLSTARRLWQQLPMVVRSRDREAVRAAAAAVFHVVDDAVATLAEGYAVARRDLVRREESLRRELIDDLARRVAIKALAGSDLKPPPPPATRGLTSLSSSTPSCRYCASWDLRPHPSLPTCIVTTVCTCVAKLRWLN
jgi:hypothetical protein